MVGCLENPAQGAIPPHCILPNIREFEELMGFIPGLFGGMGPTKDGISQSRQTRQTRVILYHQYEHLTMMASYHRRQTNPLTS